MAEGDPTATGGAGGQNPEGGTPAAGTPTPADPKATGAEPGKNGKPDDKGTSTASVDTSKFSEADWEEIFKSEAAYRNPRFKALAEKAKQADTLAAEKEATEKKALEESGKYKELYEKEQKAREEAEGKAQTARVDNAIQAEMSKQGFVNPASALKLLDRDGVKVGDNGSIEGVKEAVEQLAKDEPYLINKNQPSRIGGSTNPGGTPEGAKTFKLSEVQDTKFFQENKKEILKAAQQGLIEDDTQQT